MNNFREMYKKDVNTNQVDSYLVRKTANLIAHTKKHKYILNKKALVVLVAIIVISTATVFAGATYYAKYIFKQPPTPPHIAPVSDDFDKKEIVTDNVKITINNVVADKDVIYVSFDFETLDGTPLQVNNDNAKSELLRQEFEESYLECDGEKYKIYARRNDIAETPNKASFEAEIETFLNIPGVTFTDNPINTADLLGKEVNLVLSNLHDSVVTNKDIGFMLESVADILNNGEPCTDFIETGIHLEYADDTTTKTYTLPAGGYKIPFSDQYPNAYIDNFGFQKSGEISEGDFFYISIVPSNKEEKEIFTNLGFKNKSTGAVLYGYGTGKKDRLSDPEGYENCVKAEGDRIVIAISGWQYNRQKDITISDLKNIDLVLAEGQTQPILQQGSWKIPFIMENKNDERSFKVEQTIEGRFIDTIKISKTALAIKGEYGYEKEVEEDESIFEFKILMKDGAEISPGHKTVGWYDDENGLRFKLETTLNPDDVVGIRMWDTEIELK